MVDLKKEFTLRSVITYALAIPAAWLLTAMIWGAVMGVTVAPKAASSPEVQKAIRALLEERGIDPDDSDVEALRTLSNEDVAELKRLTLEAVSGVKWFYLTVASVLVYAVVGIVAGLVSKTWVLFGTIPIVLLCTGYSIFWFDVIELSNPQKAVVVILGQIAICSLFAYVGVRTRSRGQKSKESG